MKLKKHLKETAKYLLRCPLLIKPYIREVERLYSLSDEEMREYKQKRFVEIFRKAYLHSEFYHKLYSEAGIGIDDIKTIDDIKKLPIVTKEMVRQNGKALMTCGKHKLIGAHTSGTTGTPLEVWESWSSIWREQAQLYCYRKRCGFTMGQPLVSLRGNLDKSDTHLKVHVSNTLFLSSYNLNKETVKLYYDLICAHKPVAIEGYPSSLYSLALLLKDEGLKLQIPVAFTSSESMLDYQRELIEKVFGTQIYDLFGTTERTIMLLEAQNHEGYYEAPGYSINEFVDDGEITTSLINDDFPMIRYRGYDVMEIAEGKPQVIVQKIEGRKSSMLVGKDGTMYSGALLTRVFKDMESIDNAQFVQIEKGIVCLNVVGNKDFDEAEMAKLQSVVKEQLGESNFDFTFKRIKQEDIILTSRGKFNYIIDLQIITKGGGNS